MYSVIQLYKIISEDHPNVKERIRITPLFLDCLFTEYLRTKAPEIQNLGLPLVKDKFVYYTRITKVPHDELFDLIESFVDDPFIRDLKIQPPFILRTTMTIDELRDKLIEYMPKFKKALDLLLHVKKDNTYCVIQIKDDNKVDDDKK